MKIINKFKMIKPAKKLLDGLKNASYLMIGNIISHIVELAGFIYIARLLGPSNYGIYVTVSAFVGMFGLLTFEGLNRVVLREGAKDIGGMNKHLEKVTGIKNFFAFIAVIACIIGSFFTPYPMQTKAYITIFSFTLLYRAFNSFLGTIYQAAEKMQYNAILQILNRIIFVFLSITFLYMGFGLLALFLIALFSNFFTLTINFKLTKKFISFKFWRTIEWDRFLLKSALIFSILYFMNFLATRIDLVMISLLRSPMDVGIYGVAYKIVNSGLMARGVIATAFFPVIVKIFHKGPISWKHMLKYASLIGFGVLAIAILISFYSGQIILLLFGEEYIESGAILAVLIFYLAIVFFSIPFTNALQATYNEGQLLKVCWIAPSLNIGLNYLFLMWFGLIGIAYSTLVVTSISIFIYIVLTWRVLKKQNKII